MHGIGLTQKWGLPFLRAKVSKFSQKRHKPSEKTTSLLLEGDARRRGRPKPPPKAINDIKKTFFKKNAKKYGF